MCGIAGILSFSSPVSSSALERMANSLRHRGPDSGGIVNFGQAGLAHKRLAIIDLESGAQPLTLQDQSYSISFNGEIYNFHELRSELEARGEHFQTNSDTEVILRAYRTYGTDCLQRLKGMYAFAIWDAQNREFFCARDPFGIKPFYYAQTKELFCFASEPGALLQLSEIESEFSPEAISHYLRYGYVSHLRPLARGISALAPGHFFKVSATENFTIQRYWDFNSLEEIEVSEEDAIERVREEFARTVKSHLISDVAVGSFLSGGLDSSAVTAVAAHSAPLETFTVGFHEGYSEISEAKRLALKLHCPNTSLICEPEKVFSDIFTQLDEPHADASLLPLYSLCEGAARKLKVLLSGDGGDENFGGYTWHDTLLRQSTFRRIFSYPSSPINLGKNLGRWERIRGVIHLLAFLQPLAKSYSLYRSVFQREECRRLLRPEFPVREDDYFKDDPGEGMQPLRELQKLDFQSYLVDDILTKVDRVSMAHGLEVRVPLLDSDFVRFAWSLPSSLKFRSRGEKYVFREAMKGLISQEAYASPKRGFSPPIRSWLNGPLRGSYEETFLSANASILGYVRKEELNSLRSWYESPSRFRTDPTQRVWALVCLEAWLKGRRSVSRISGRLLR